MIFHPHHSIVALVALQSTIAVDRGAAVPGQGAAPEYQGNLLQFLSVESGSCDWCKRFWAECIKNSRN